MSDNQEPDRITPWYHDEDEVEQDGGVDEYDITAAPNDFNVRTICDFITSGAVTIPGFQRNYVWDLTRASKLIESILIGLPIPQVFLYEESRNKFLVIDGQQRLMTIYYFMQQRFPRMEKRASLRAVFAKYGNIPPEILHSDDLFTKFNLRLPSKTRDKPNRFKGLSYHTLGDLKTQFDLRTIRNVIIKQSLPPNDDSSIYEIFNRLNSGGINLKAQEIRTSLYHSPFYDALHRLNALPIWRKMIGLPEPDLHMKDIEIILRGFAMLIDGEDYRPSMTKFLNGYSKKCRSLEGQQVEYLEELFKGFLLACEQLPAKAFYTKRGGFNISLFDSVFAASVGDAFRNRTQEVVAVSASKLMALQEDDEFSQASQSDTASSVNVLTRLRRAREVLL